MFILFNLIIQNDELRKKYKIIKNENLELNNRIKIYCQKVFFSILYQIDKLNIENKKLEKISIDEDLRKKYTDNEKRKRKNEIDSLKDDINKLTSTNNDCNIQIMDLV